MAARNHNIPSVAIIEHWALYLERFSIIRNGDIVKANCFLPDHIWVNDKTAVNEAILAGLPAERLKSMGQPHLEQLYLTYKKQQRATVSQNRNIVFISERIKEDLPSGSSLYLGFDEFVVINMLLKVMNSKWERLQIKLHPQENPDKYNALLEKHQNLAIIQHCEIPTLIMNSGKIVGMLSMLLIEAALYRNDIISVTPNTDRSIFIGNRMGITQSATTLNELDEFINTKHQIENMKLSFGEKFLHSKKRVIFSIEELVA